jgi:hypothetical protein
MVLSDLGFKFLLHHRFLARFVSGLISVTEIPRRSTWSHSRIEKTRESCWFEKPGSIFTG